MEIRAKKIARITFPFKKLRKPSIKVISHPHISKNVFDVIKHSQKELCFISPFITYSPMKSVLNHVKDHILVRVIAGTKSAYAAVVDASKDSGKKVLVKYRGQVHSKVLASDSECLISSFNITQAGLEKQTEVGILTNDLNIVRNVKDFFNRFWDREYEYKEEYYGGKIELNTPTQTAFISSVTNLPYLIFDLLKEAKKEVTIVSPFLDYEAVKKITDCINKGVQINAIVKVDERAWEEGRADPWAIDLLVDRCKGVWEKPDLHAKILIVDNSWAIISSMNITHVGLGRNFEAGLYTKNPDVINALKIFIESLKVKPIDEWELERKIRNYLKVMKSTEVRFQDEGDHYCDEKELELTRDIKVGIEKDFAYPFHSGYDLKLEPPPRKIRVIRRKIKKSRPVDQVFRPKPVDLVVIEDALILGALLCNRHCKLDDLIRIVEEKVSPAFCYFPFKIQFPFSLRGKNWSDSDILGTCLKFLSEKGQHGIRLIYRKNEVHLEAREEYVKEFIKKYKSVFLTLKLS